MRSSEPQVDATGSGGLEVVVVTGLSGSGKSTAIRAFEDLGFYCIDNLPVVLVPPFLALCTGTRERIGRVGLGIDIRERQFLAAYPAMLETLRAAGHRVEVLFLDAGDEVLVRRFSETRRPHPLGAEGGPPAGIARERTELAALREEADRIIDTSALTVHELRDALRRLYRHGARDDALTILLVSFGFKYGVPTDVDMVLDARFLPNPHFVEALRPGTGCDPAVAAFVLERDETRRFLAHVEALLAFGLPLYRREGRTFFTLALGCTGGRHRSVALAECLAQRLTQGGGHVQVQHRDMRR